MKKNTSLQYKDLISHADAVSIRRKTWLIVFFGSCLSWGAMTLLAWMIHAC